MLLQKDKKMEENSSFLKTVLIDIDGCLNTYPDCFIEWANKYYNQNYKSIGDIKSRLELQAYEKVKAKYRTSGVKRNLPIRKNAKICIAQLLKSHFVIIYTSRNQNSQSIEDTKYWLFQNNIRYDCLIFLKRDNKFDVINRLSEFISFIIEDDMELIKNASLLNLTIFSFNRILNTNDNVYQVKNWKTIKELVIKLNL